MSTLEDTFFIASCNHLFFGNKLPRYFTKRKELIRMIDNYTPTIIKNVATRIDLLRTEQNLSLRDLALKSGISKSELSNIILGNKIPNVYTLHLICNALSISLSDFFDFDDNVIKLRGKEAVLIKIFRELSPMSQDTLIKLSKCMR